MMVWILRSLQLVLLLFKNSGPGVSSSILGSAGSEWKITGKNSGESILVGFSTNVATAKGPKMWNGETWSTFDTNAPVNIVITGDQDIPPDTYPLTLDLVGYRP